MTEDFFEELDCTNWNREIIIKDEKVMTVYFMLEHRQRVDMHTFFEIFGATQRTFTRVISTIRKALENAGLYETQIIYNRSTQSYELIKAHFRISKAFLKLNN